MNYIYCGSHLPLLFALYLKQLKKKITVITCSNDVKNFCSSQNIDVILIDYIRPTFSSFYKIFTLKRIIDKKIEKIDFPNANFFLTANIKSYDSFYLAKELSKKGCKIFYVNTLGVDYKKYKSTWLKPIFFRGGFLRFCFKLFMGLDLTYLTVADVPMFGIDERFFKKYSVKKYPLKLSQEELILDVAKKNKLKSKSYDNLIVDEGSLKNILEPGSMKKVYKNLSKFSIKYAFKRHPRPTEDHSLSNSIIYDLFQNCEEIPRYIPIELLFNSIKKNVISVYSAALYTASQFNHLNAISVLELVDWCNDNFKEDVKNLLVEKSNNKIIFPKDFDELEKILTSK